MGIGHFCVPMRAHRGKPALAAVVLACVFGMSWTNSPAQSTTYTMNWSTITAGGVTHLRSSCYRLSGSIGFLSPGIVYSGTSAYTLFTGFWVAAPIIGQDEIFYNGFEDCKS